MRQRDLANQPHRDRILKPRMRIAQHVDAVLCGLVDVLQHVEQIVGLINRFFAAVATDAARDAPRHQHLVLQVRRLGKQLEDARLFVRRDQDDRKARTQQRTQLLYFVTGGLHRPPAKVTGPSRPNRLGTRSTR